MKFFKILFFGVVGVPLVLFAGYFGWIKIEIVNSSPYPLELTQAEFHCGRSSVYSYSLLRFIDKKSTKLTYITWMIPCDTSLILTVKFKANQHAVDCGYASSGIFLDEAVHVLEINPEGTQIRCNYFL